MAREAAEMVAAAVTEEEAAKSGSGNGGGQHHALRFPRFPRIYALGRRERNVLYFAFAFPRISSPSLTLFFSFLHFTFLL